MFVSLFKQYPVEIIFYEEHTMREKLKSTKLWQIISVFLLICLFGAGCSDSSEQARINELETSVQTLQEQNDTLQKENDGLNSDIASLQSEIESTSLENTNLQSEIETLKKQLEETDTYEQQIADLQSQIETLTAEKEELSSENKALEEKVNSYESAAAKSSSGTAKVSSSDSGNHSDTGSSGGGVTVYITKTGDKYHTGSCSYLKKSKIAIDKDTAIAQGYTACSRCNP